MKKLSLLIFLFISTTILSSAQINLDYVDIDTSIIIISDDLMGVGKTGPVFLATIDSTNYELDRLSFEEINPEWIQTIRVFKAPNTPKRFSIYKGKDLIVITPKDSSKQKFHSLVFDRETRKRMIK